MHGTVLYGSLKTNVCQPVQMWMGFGLYICVIALKSKGGKHTSSI